MGLPMICLIRPPAVESFRFSSGMIIPPLGLAYIAAALEHAGRRVCVLDAIAEGPTVRTRYCKGYLFGLRLDDLVARIPPQARAVGISVTFTYEWPAVVRLVEVIKRTRPDLTVILGGEHVTSMPEFCLMTSRADFLVMGEGEETIVELLDALDGSAALESVDGIGYRQNAQIIINKRRVRNTDVDAIALPAWHHFKLRTYHEHRLVGGIYSEELTVPILATRGCPYQCTYCSSPNMWLPTWIPREPKKVVDEIELYIDRYNARSFPLQDLTAIIKKQWIVDFCREIINRRLRITWQLPSGTRAEAIDDEVSLLLKESGMVGMAYAPEAGSDETRKLIKKKMKSDRLFSSMQAAVRADLYVMVFMVIGFPHDEPAHLRDSLPFIDRLVSEGAADMSVGYYMALPGTELFHTLWSAGKIKLDRAYFAHILEAQALFPSRTYCASVSRVGLALWKLRMFRRFYAPGFRRLFTTIYHSLSGLGGSANHQSRLQTAFYNGLKSGWEMSKAMVGPRWMSRAEEASFFTNWDQIYRDVRNQKLATGVAQEIPTDSQELHRVSVTPMLKREHGAAQVFDAPSTTT